MRAAESLFGSECENLGHPVVSYATSSLYISRAHARAGEDKEQDGMSFFELMSHSSLWAELRKVNKGTTGSNGLPDKTTSSSFAGVSRGEPGEVPFASLPDHIKSGMKDLVYHAVGGGTLESHDVLLHVQCRPWDRSAKVWGDLQAYCTAQVIEAALEDLVADERLETVGDTQKYRRTAGATSRNSASASAPVPEPSKCMKFAKPWKRGKMASTPVK